MSSEILAQLAAALGKGGIRVVDLSQTLRPETPVIQLPPEFAPSSPFRIEEISHYDARGPAWYWNNIACGEHTGTHFDAPAHWVTGKDYADGFTDTIAVQRFVAPACVIDCSKEAAADERFVMEPAHIQAFEARHGRIPAGAWVLMRTDWSKRTEPAAFLNLKDDGPHTPGPSAAAVRFLVEERAVNGFGVEAVGTDHGQAFGFEPAFPAHNLMHGAGKFGLASLCNLDQLPPTGALLITAPLKIARGSGSPLRVLALIPARGAGGRREPFRTAVLSTGTLSGRRKPPAQTGVIRRPDHAPRRPKKAKSLNLVSSLGSFGFSRAKPVVRAAWAALRPARPEGVQECISD